jgi:sugar (pentulose or hexulose) kinase
LVRLVSLDLGTSGIRYQSCDINGKVLATGRCRFGEETVKEWLISLKGAIPKRTRLSSSDDVILSAQGTSGTALLVDEYGNDLFRPLMYYEKDIAQFKRIERLKSRHNLSRKGISISVTSPLPKILGIKEKYPQMFQKVRWILPATTWLLYRLVHGEGEKWEDVRTDWTNALKFGADITRDDPSWYEPLFHDVGLSTDILPRIVSCGEELGNARSNLARELGLKRARVFQGMTDGNGTALAVGCVEDGDFGFSSGSATAIKYVCSKMKHHRAIYYHRHPFGGFLAGAAPVTLSTLRWFAEKIMGIGVEKAFELAARGDLLQEYLYFPQGDREPFEDPELGASFLKIWAEDASKEAARGTMFRSMVLGLTFFEYYYLSLLEKLFNREISEAKITGGGTRSPWWNKLRASIYGIPVKVMDERPGIGSLMPAVMRLSLFKDLEEAQHSLLRVNNTYHPDKNLGSKYAKLRDTFLKRWNVVREASATI